MRTVTNIELMAEVQAMAVLANRVFISPPFWSRHIPNPEIP
jgi:hypothetical protein